jgi:hypothetical protein
MSAGLFWVGDHDQKLVGITIETRGVSISKTGGIAVAYTFGAISKAFFSISRGE